MSVMKEFESGLIELSRQPELHARFVNTLSLLEYIGARKIFKSQRAEDFSIQLLAHAAEEIRHAQMLKKVALRMSDGVLDSYREEHLHLGREAREYLQSVDHAWAGPQSLGWSETQRYALTTLLLEERAVLLYAVYEPILADSGHPGVLSAILRDEDRHMLEVTQELAECGMTPEEIELVREVERKSFGALERAFLRSLGAERGLSLAQVKRHASERKNAQERLRVD